MKILDFLFGPNIDRLVKDKDYNNLIQATKHGKANIRESAVLALGSFKDEKYVLPLIVATSDQENQVRIAAYKILLKYPDLDLDQYFIGGIEDAEPKIKKISAYYLARKYKIDINPANREKIISSKNTIERLIGLGAFNLFDCNACAQTFSSKDLHRCYQCDEDFKGIHIFCQKCFKNHVNSHMKPNYEYLYKEAERRDLAKKIREENPGIRPSKKINDDLSFYRK